MFIGGCKKENKEAGHTVSHVSLFFIFCPYDHGAMIISYNVNLIDAYD